MAVSHVGTVYNGSGGTGSNSISSITIHSDCELSVVIVSGSGGSNNTEFDILNWDAGADIETGWNQIVAVGGGGGLAAADSYAMLESHANHPSAGSTGQTLTWSVNDQSYGTCTACVFFLDTVHATVPIGDTDSDHTESSVTSWTASLTLDADDMAVFAAFSYYDLVFTSNSGQTNIYDSGNNIESWVDYEVNESAPGVTFPSKSYTGFIAFVVEAGAGGGPTAVSKAGELTSSGVPTRLLAAARALSGEI